MLLDFGRFWILVENWAMLVGDLSLVNVVLDASEFDSSLIEDEDRIVADRDNNAEEVGDWAAIAGDALDLEGKLGIVESIFSLIGYFALFRT